MSGEDGPADAPGTAEYQRYVEGVGEAADGVERRRGEEISHFMLERADILVIGLRPDGVISIFNKKCQDLTGYFTDAPHGKEVLDRVTPVGRLEAVSKEKRPKPTWAIMAGFAASFIILMIVVLWRW